MLVNICGLGGGIEEPEVEASPEQQAGPQSTEVPRPTQVPISEPLMPTAPADRA